MPPKTITVIDADGKESFKMLSNETGYQHLLQNLRVHSLLLDMNGRPVEVYDFESLMDGGTYTLGPPMTPVSSDLKQDSEQMDRIEKKLDEIIPVSSDQIRSSELKQDSEQMDRIEKKLDDMATLSMGMSEATQDFTRELLNDKGIIFTTLPLCNDIQDEAFRNRIYQWGEDEDEKDGQQGCIQMLERELLPLSVDGRALGIFDVRGLALPEVHEGKRKSNGFTDLAIGDLETLSAPDTRDLTFGLSPALVELKTGKAALKQGQLLLQLVSLSEIANARRGVIVLGTDCATKWRLVYFAKFNEIAVQQYKCGKKCLVDMCSLIKDSTENGKSLVAPPRLTTTGETAFLEDTDDQDAAKSSAYLHAVANHLASLFPSEREALAPMMDDGISTPPSMIYL